jgi:uncharacterized protein (DUF488 family)
LRHIFTIGFSKKSLREFINLLKTAKVSNLVDVRLNNTSQLAGFAKKDDLAYVLELVGIKYAHDPSLAPDSELFDSYKKGKVNWAEYEKCYNDILGNRRIQDRINEIVGSGTPVFLCSEEKADFCHRRLLAEYIKKHANEELTITHLA